MKERELYQLKKKVAESESRLKQQQTLYEAVCSDRNLCSKSLIEARDDITELKRKLKIMSHQIDQLKEEIASKVSLPSPPSPPFPSPPPSFPPPPCAGGCTGAKQHGHGARGEREGGAECRAVLTEAGAGEQPQAGGEPADRGEEAQEDHCRGQCRAGPAKEGVGAGGQGRWAGLHGSNRLVALTVDYCTFRSSTRGTFLEHS